LVVVHAKKRNNKKLLFLDLIKMFIYIYTNDYITMKITKSYSGAVEGLQALENGKCRINEIRDEAGSCMLEKPNTGT
jgi:ArsR family metal-binding transcriptional regulator